MEKVFDAARCRSVHGLQRLRGGVPVSRDHDAPGLEGGVRRRRAPSPQRIYSASIPAAFTMRPHFCDSLAWNLAISSGDAVKTSVPVGS